MKTPLDPFDAIEIHAMRRDPTTGDVEPFDDQHIKWSVPDFWAIVGHLKAGGTDDICDCLTEEMAEFIAGFLRPLVDRTPNDNEAVAL